MLFSPLLPALVSFLFSLLFSFSSSLTSQAAPRPRRPQSSTAASSSSSSARPPEERPPDDSPHLESSLPWARRHRGPPRPRRPFLAPRRGGGRAGEGWRRRARTLFLFVFDLVYEAVEGVWKGRRRGGGGRLREGSKNLSQAVLAFFFLLFASLPPCLAIRQRRTHCPLAVFLRKPLFFRSHSNPDASRQP